MLLTILLVIFVIAGFLAWFAATWPGYPLAERAARGCFLLASLIWAFETIGGR